MSSRENDGAQFDRVELDEFGGEDPRREVVIQRPDGTTYSAAFPADFDLGEVLRDGEVVAFDAGLDDPDG